jgi:hypothetical protein
MAITTFSLLTTTDKLAILQADGVYLGKRSVGPIHIILYQYQKLYVEIFYKKYRMVVDRIRCSENLAILEPYFELISVEEIL